VRKDDGRKDGDSKAGKFFYSESEKENLLLRNLNVIILLTESYYDPLRRDSELYQVNSRKLQSEDTEAE
jgi:hypothetical protein